MTNNVKKTYNRRGLWVALVVLVMFVFLLILNIRGFLFIQRAGVQFETSMDKRLQATAATATTLIENNLVSLYLPADITLMRLSLAEILKNSDSQAAYIIDADMNVLVDAAPDQQLNRGYVQQDSLAIAAALKQKLVISPLYMIAGNPFKNAYSRLEDQDGNLAILVLEANADFFDTLRFYRGSLVFNSLFSAVLFISLTIFLIFATRQFLRTEKQLQDAQRLAALGQMSATMAHEIRNPLAIIKSTSDVLAERYNRADEQDELFQFINDEIKRLNKLVNDFLTFSRKPILTKTACELNTLVEEAISAVQRQNPHAVQLQLYAAEKITTLCDADKIFQVLLNILLNAMQAIGNISGEISIHLQKNKQTAFITIRDNGPGFTGAPEELFEPFSTTKTHGTGLGLAVSKSIIQEHGGTISAKNLTNGGAQMTFTLPIIL